MIRCAVLIICAFGLVANEPKAPHVAVYERIAPTVVGLTCQAPFRGQPGNFFGTGVVVQSDGLVLTSTTVIPDKATDIKVYLTDGRILPAELIDSDAASEGALLRITGEHEPFAAMELGDSTTLKIGDPVYTCGNPHYTIQRHGKASISLGRISGLPVVASVDDQSRYNGPVIEVDAAINAGSDGGPLTDAQGRLVGLQSLAFSQMRWLGLAVPLQSMREGLEELSAIAVVKASGDHPSWDRSPALMEAVNKVGDAVVGIWVERKGDSMKAPETWMRETVSDRPTLPSGQQRLRAERTLPQGGATGFLVSADGLVVTAAHIVGPRLEWGARGPEKAKKNKGKVEKIWVYDAKGERHEATLLGQDEARDVAVLRLDGDGQAWPHIPLGETFEGSWRVGNPVAVLGRSEAPGSLSANVGPISALMRRRNHSVQVQAMINVGNAGGPVIDSQGHLLGMAHMQTARVTWRQNSGVGFVFKHDKLAEAVTALADGNTLPPLLRPMVGVSLDVAVSGGAGIKDVTLGGPAEKAGLQGGDVITSWNGETIESRIDLVNRIITCDPGFKAQVGIQRGDEELTLEVIVGSDAEEWFTTSQPGKQSAKPQKKPKAQKKKKKSSQKKDNKSDKSEEK